MIINDLLINFELKSVDNLSYKSEEIFTNQHAKVVVFTCNHCPYAIAYITRINTLVKKYAQNKVKIVAINSNDAAKYPSDSFENMIPMAEKLGLGSYYLHDIDQKTAHAYQAKRTPEVFLFDKSDKLVYKGAIDNNWESAKMATEPYLENAIDSLLKNEEVNLKETQAVGCSIKWK